jgi:hypothetical protein
LILKCSAKEVFEDERANAVVIKYSLSRTAQGCMQLGVSQLKTKQI